MPKTIVHPLAPVHDDESRILLLGTMPSVRSRAAGFYYMHPQNRFWPVLCDVLGEPRVLTAEERRMMVLRRHIALWDVLEQCEMDGSLDATIREPVANDIAGLLGRAPIRAIFTTGTKATELYRRLVREKTGYDCIPLPSTSPANRKYGADEVLREAYRQILRWLEPECVAETVTAREARQDLSLE